MVDSVAGFIEEILGRNLAVSRLASYRGHSKDTYELKPFVYRTQEQYQNKHILLRELIAAHPDEFAADGTALEMLVRMQHFSLPTRLLDVTTNPLVALYFACESASTTIVVDVNDTRRRRQIPTDGEVIIFTLPKTRVRYFDSDTVSILANLSRLSYRLKNRINPSMGKEDFNESTSIKRLLHFVRQEKNGFEADIEPEDLNEIIFIKPKLKNRRILAQSGAFFVFGLVQEMPANDPSIARVSRIRIDAAGKQQIRADLDKLGINEKSLFPDIERAARYLSGGVASAAALARITP